MILGGIPIFMTAALNPVAAARVQDGMLDVKPDCGKPLYVQVAQMEVFLLTTGHLLEMIFVSILMGVHLGK